jgi:hypothetical protein
MVAKIYDHLARQNGERAFNLEKRSLSLDYLVGAERKYRRDVKLEAAKSIGLDPALEHTQDVPAPLNRGFEGSTLTAVSPRPRATR